MNKKALSLGMIVPLAAAGAVATAPAASANTWHHRDSVSCHLDALRLVGSNRILLKLDVDSRGWQGRAFRVRINQNGFHTILSRTVWDRNGDFTRYTTARNTPGPDFFRASVRNIQTGDSDTCTVVVRGRR